MKLITTHPDYILWVDESQEIDKNDWIICNNTNTLNHFKVIKNLIPKGLVDKLWIKIIAHRPLNNAPLLKGVDLLPELPKQAIVNFSESLLSIPLPAKFIPDIDEDWLKENPPFSGPYTTKPSYKIIKITYNGIKVNQIEGIYK